MGDNVLEEAKAFDHGSAEYMQNPYSIYSRLRARCPVARSGNYGGFSLASRYDDVRKILMDHEVFSATSGTGIPPVPFQMCPTDIDPPEQTHYRKLLNPHFTRQAIETLRPEISGHVHLLIDSFIEEGRCDLASQLIRPLLPKVIIPLVGLPYEDHEVIAGWAEFLSHNRGTDIEGCRRVSGELRSYLLDVIARRRQEPPRDDLLGLLLFQDVGSRKLDDEQVFGTVMILLFGGLDTTSAVLLETLLFLDRELAARERLQTDPAIWPSAIEEFVRYSSPVQGVTRLVLLNDVEMSDVPLPKGEIVMALIGSANRDESKFPFSDKCIIDRPSNVHVGFGTGVHLCLGRYLARLEIEIVLRAVLDRLSDYRVVEGFEPRYSPSEVRGMLSLPVRFSPSTRRRSSG